MEPTNAANFRAPAFPIASHTPFFSIWAMADDLTDRATKHWTGTNNSICGLLRIDGAAYRFIGPDPSSTPAMEQVGVAVTPTRTTYQFAAAGIKLVVEFLSPLLIDDLDVLARPVTYITLTASSTDGKEHEVTAYIDVCAETCVDDSREKVFASRHQVEGLTTLACRAANQPILGKTGDRVRIDWGTLLLSVPNGSVGQSAIGSQHEVRGAFATSGQLPASDDMRFPRRARDGWPVLATTLSLGSVGADEVSTYAMVAYDEEFAVEYLNRRLKPYWRRDGEEIQTLLLKAASEHDALRERCREFDAKLTEELTRAGGARFAQLGALAYRQCICAHGLVEDADGMLMMFSKENDSNGCMGTVDVTYPASPFFLHLSPTLLKAQVEPVLKYAALPRWRFPFAPHDLGQYPLANGQVYGGGEHNEQDQMPVEECGNMLIMVSALCMRDGNDDFAHPYLSVLNTWAEYLLQKGLDPENQLCTDDFAGHMAHNANLAIKAIVALGAYAEVCTLAGDPDRAKRYRTQAKAMAAKWMELAADGDHTRLAFDQPGTWAQKYNLVWDRILGLGLFPSDLASREVAYYLTKLNQYGLPLDSRKDYTKLDWCVWTATLADRREDFEAMVEPLLRFCEDTPDRVPLSDWFDTVTSKHMAFEARSVVGGVFIPLLGRVG